MRRPGSSPSAARTSDAGRSVSGTGTGLGTTWIRAAGTAPAVSWRQATYSLTATTASAAAHGTRVASPLASPRSPVCTVRAPELWSCTTTRRTPDACSTALAGETTGRSMSQTARTRARRTSSTAARRDAGERSDRSRPIGSAALPASASGRVSSTG